MFERIQGEFLYWYWHARVYLGIVGRRCGWDDINWRVGPVSAWEITRAICKDEVA